MRARRWGGGLKTWFLDVSSPDRLRVLILQVQVKQLAWRAFLRIDLNFRGPPFAFAILRGEQIYRDDRVDARVTSSGIRKCVALSGQLACVV